MVFGRKRDPQDDAIKSQEKAVRDKAKIEAKEKKSAEREAKAQQRREEQKARAEEKLSTADAAEKRQQYEEMLAVGRKSGHYRLVAEKNERTKRMSYVLQPGGLVFQDRDLAEIALEYFNSKPRKS